MIKKTIFLSAFLCLLIGCRENLPKKAIPKPIATTKPHQPSIAIQVDREKLAMLGISMTEFDDQFKAYIRKNGEPKTVEQFSQVTIVSPRTGKTHQLSEFARITRK